MLPNLVIRERSEYKCVYETEGVDADNDVWVRLVGTISEFDSDVIFVAARQSRSLEAFVNLKYLRSATSEEIRLLVTSGLDEEDFKASRGE